MSDGRFHSGEVLGALLGVSRAAVWKRLQQLEDIGINVLAVKGKGYQLVGGLDLLSEEKIHKYIQVDSLDLHPSVYVFPVLDSTNTWLMKKLAEPCPQGVVCMAEMQKSGRGRRGRQWHSPFASNLYLSLGWTFEQGVIAVEGLSLAVGVVIAETMSRLGVNGIELKWPNDLLFEDKKIGGILIELVGDASGDCHVIVGLGFNVSMPKNVDIDQPWTDLTSISQVAVSRNQLAGEFISALLKLFQSYEVDGFAEYKNRWEKLNVHKNAFVVLQSVGGATEGECLGVSHRGELRLLVDGKEKLFAGGELSLRGCN